jgi:glycosyltransferase involved in cell wall biosynthesis
LSISSNTTDVFIELNALNKNNIYYLPPSVNLGLSSNASNPYDDKYFNILSLSRLHKADSYKGIDSMIKTIPLLLNSISNIKLTIIGDGDDKERLVQLSQDMKVENYIDFKGFVKDIEPYYKYCDIFVLPSNGEGFGIVYLEAMKHRKACIACDEGGQTDVVLDNQTGYLCKYDDLNCLVSRITLLFNNPDMAQVMGCCGYDHLLDNFTFDSFKNRLNFILND